MTNFPKDAKIVIPGGAGLVGQNLVVCLLENGYSNIYVIDKNSNNARICQELHPNVTVITEDISKEGIWIEHVKEADIIIQLQAQIGGLHEREFIDNNVTSTSLLLESINKEKPPYIIHISSSVVNSLADDFYTQTKEKQEDLVKSSGHDFVILRPTLMFGWFDRKHLGWLARFMQKVPVFPIPGHGKYIRQPLYVMDFCNIITSCIKSKPEKEIYNISGLERVDYIDIIKAIKKVTNAKATILKIPYSLFYMLLKIYALFSSNPPFTTKQLEALVIKEEFEMIEWPDIFNISKTPFEKAIDETFNHKTYSDIVLEF